jgi:DNA polymerase-4
LAQGIDESPVTPPSKVKSIGKETTFTTNITEKAILIKELLKISQMVGYIARKKGYKGRTITLKIRFHDFITFNRSKTLENPTHLDDKDDKLEQLTQSLDKIREKFGSKAVTRASLLKIIKNNHKVSN